MTNLGPEKLQLPPTFLFLCLFSYSDKEGFLLQLVLLLSDCFHVVFSHPHHKPPCFLFTAFISDEKKIGWSF